MAGTVEQQVAGGGIQRRQIVLAKDEHAVGIEAAAGVVGEKGSGFSIRGGTGHDRQRHVAAIPPADGHEPAEQHFEEIGFRHRADAAESLRPMAAQTGALSSGHEDRADLSGTQRLSAAADRVGRRDAIAGIAQSQAGGGDGGGEIDGRGSTLAVAGSESPHLLDQWPVNRLQLECEGPLGRLVEPIPEG